MWVGERERERERDEEGEREREREGERDGGRMQKYMASVAPFHSIVLYGLSRMLNPIFHIPSPSFSFIFVDMTSVRSSHGNPAFESTKSNSGERNTVDPLEANRERRQTYMDGHLHIEEDGDRCRTISRSINLQAYKMMKTIT